MGHLGVPLRVKRCSGLVLPESYPFLGPLASFLLRYSPVGGGEKAGANPDLAFCSDFTPLARCVLAFHSLVSASSGCLPSACDHGSSSLEPCWAGPRNKRTETGQESAGSTWKVSGPGHPGPGNQGWLQPPAGSSFSLGPGPEQGLTGLRTRHGIRKGATQQTVPHTAYILLDRQLC